MSKSVRTEETSHLADPPRSNPDQVAARASANIGMNHAAGRRSLRVLIVDNERDSADTLSESISSWGHEVRWAYETGLGLEVATAQVPDVALLNLVMPQTDGYELAQQLRRDARLKSCFLVAMRRRTERRRQTKGADFDIFLPKPVDLDVLETLLLMEGERLDRLQAHTQSV